MEDIEIARRAHVEDILAIAKKIGVEGALERYGNDKGKIDYRKISTKRDSKLILVTAISPTPYGEGKTTVSIGLNDGLTWIGKKSLAVLREPSLGPVFGVKGGATGGGYAQVVPMEDINLHFTGDFHAITSANNLIAAAIDNHIYFGNSLHLDLNRICFKRCMDMNDRALRRIDLGSRQDGFNITAASEVMSVLCLADDFHDLQDRLGSILIGYNTFGDMVYVRDLKLEGALATLLKDAIKPNLVQSLENNPVLIHGGPFANIAHGCNSVIATKLGLKLADYVVTEAGFGSDLGAEKFFDIKCRSAKLKPDVVVLVATIKALKHHGVSSLDKDDDGLKKGLSNLRAHIDNLRCFTKNIIVALNRYATDTDEEVEVVRDFVSSLRLPFSSVTSYSDGGKGAIDLAEKVVLTSLRENDFHLLYGDDLSLFEKIDKLASCIYHASSVHIGENTLKKLNQYIQLGYGNYPICVAKTQYSISDDPKKLGYPKDYELVVTDCAIYTGAKFIVLYLGNIMTMPGLSKMPNYLNISIDDEGNIKGLF